jgi:hypothetical protein
LWDSVPPSVTEAWYGKLLPSFGPLGLLADDVGSSKADSNLIQAVVDTGASMTITFCRDDFISYKPLKGKHVVGGLAHGSPVVGTGIVEWHVEVNDVVVPIKLNALHVPAATQRLLDPQQLKRDLFPTMKRIEIDDSYIVIHFPQGDCICPNSKDSNLPMITICSAGSTTKGFKALTASLQLEQNQNLTASQKELLKWHFKLGHCDLKRVQRLLKTGAFGSTPLINAAANCDLNKLSLLCGSCAFGKQKRRSKTTKSNQVIDPVAKAKLLEKLLSKEVLIPGQKVSMDHFIVSSPGRLFSSRGREASDKMYKGGVIFVDHASGYVHIEPVVNFTAGKALRAKRAFEREMLSMGVTVLNYHTDNGVFTAQAYQDELAKLNQQLSLSGVGAHHQNAMAERMIGVTVAMARTMMLHAKMRWPNQVSTKLWPMALKHAQHLHNHLPGTNNVCPLDLVLRTTVPRHALKNLHVWGCPVYVLDPKLQDGGHIPKFEPRSRMGLHLGWSPMHASTVPLILNLTTGHVSPQYHVLFDDWFTTVDSSELSLDDGIDSPQWVELFNNGKFQVAFDDDDPIELDDEWLSETERLAKHQRAVQRVHSGHHSVPPTPAVDPKGAPTASPGPAPTPAPAEKLEAPTAPAPAQQAAPPAAPFAPSFVPSAPESNEPQRELPHQREQPSAPPTKSKRRTEAELLQDGLSSKPTSSTRTRPALGKFKGMVAGMIALLGNNVALQAAVSTVGQPAAQAALLGFDAVTATFDEIQPNTFMALTAASSSKARKAKGLDPDYPTYSQAMRGPDSDEWIASMLQELKTLQSMGTWTAVPRSEVASLGAKIIPTTWALRVKRDPAGNPTKKKSRWCVRGDIQKRTMDVESYSPVVQWSSVRLMLILSIVHGLQTRQVDYVNAFVQADLDKDVYVEPPQGFSHLFPEGSFLKLNKSLYGMTDAPLIFFELLKSNLQKVGFKQFQHIDPCLFVHKKAICLTYVDDCLWFGKDGAALDALIQQMQKAGMDLTVESNDVSAFLGIQFTRKGETIELKQVGLINKIIETTGMKDCNPDTVPAAPKPLGKDPNGEPFDEPWSYRSVVGQLLYLAGNSRPDIAFAVHQAARFSHDPKKSHGVAIKRIVRYLQGTKDKGMVFKPTGDWKIDCWVDADFCGLWGSEDPDDPIVTKSRTGYIITLAGCPLLWVSKLQTETSVSTMMAEYVALSAAMRDLLPLKRLVKTVAKVVTGDDNVKVVTKSDVFEDNNGALTVATLPKITPQSKFFAVKLHFFKEHVKTDTNPHGEVVIQKIETTKQLADIMTKGLVAEKFKPLRDALMGWDLNEEGKPKLLANSPSSKLHSRGSVGDVNEPSVLLALVCSACHV